MIEAWISYARFLWSGEPIAENRKMLWSLCVVLCAIGLCLLGKKMPFLRFPGKLFVCSIVVMAMLFLLCRFRMKQERFKWFQKCVCIPAVLAFVLSVTYARADSGFQADSNAIVYSRIAAQYDHVPMNAYGLQIYTDLRGRRHPDFFKPFVTDKKRGFSNGYNEKANEIVLDLNPHTSKYAVARNRLRFASGDEAIIASVKDDADGRHLRFANGFVVAEKKLGTLAKAYLLGSSGNPLPRGITDSYGSQYGLQGIVMGWMAHTFGWTVERSFEILPIICAVSFAMAVVATVYLLRRKYNTLFATAFFLVFWLSTWVGNFARSVYWVEVTWILPAVIGLALSVWQENRCVRYAAYVALLLTVMVKSLCGYEYLTFVMLGGILPLLTDCLLALHRGEKHRAWTIAQRVFMAGVFSLTGFCIAMGIHADLRGAGDIRAGLQSIYEKDVLRRTIWGDPAKFPNRREPTADSIRASFFTVLLIYAKKVYVMVALLPVLAFYRDWKKAGKVSSEDAILYMLAFLSSVSWLFFGKSHSFIHRHMNYVVWFYWFVPVAFYILLKRVQSAIRVSACFQEGGMSLHLDWKSDQKAEESS